jgi:hypothetical protein
LIISVALTPVHAVWRACCTPRQPPTQDVWCIFGRVSPVKDETVRWNRDYPIFPIWMRIFFSGVFQIFPLVIRTCLWENFTFPSAPTKKPNSDGLLVLKRFIGRITGPAFYWVSRDFFDSSALCSATMENYHRIYRSLPGTYFVAKKKKQDPVRR